MVVSNSPPTVAGLRQAYRDGTDSPVDAVKRIFAAIEAGSGREAWIYLREAESVLAEAQSCERELAAGSDDARPLLGIPYAVKDNIDVAGLPTTAGCPTFGYTAGRDAAVVERLRAAGAILIGKTNLDQFATGLVGTRSPYGAVGNPFDGKAMTGGSSSGSAAVVARGWAAFSLGTDTAGSGRVPAGACNLVGVKPTPGLVSGFGVVPACRSIDCVSVFAHTVADGWEVLRVLAGRDERDCFSNPPQELGPLTRGVRIGIPATLEFFDDGLARRAWDAALAAIAGMSGVEFVAIDFKPFQAVAKLLYEGPWVAERLAAVGDFVRKHGEEMDSTVHGIIAAADALSAVDAFKARYELETLRRPCMKELARADVLLVPTAPTLYRHAQIAASPLALNSRLGFYTNFVNLLGLAALSLPGPFRADGLPAGVTLIGAAGADYRLAELGRRWQASLHTRLGLTHEAPATREAPLPPLASDEESVAVAVVGAHLSGFPLNWQLVERGARLLETTRTAPCYRLFALPGTTPPKPGLLRVATGGAAIEVEVWSMPLKNFGRFVAEIAPPLGIGSLLLASGQEVKGFICEASALDGAQDITALGGWRAYAASRVSK